MDLSMKVYRHKHFAVSTNKNDSDNEAGHEGFFYN